MGYDARCFTAALVSLAVKGWLRITEAEGAFSLVRMADKHTPLSPAERGVSEVLPASPGAALQLEQANHATLRAAIDRLRRALAREYESKLFRVNRHWILPGLGLSVAVLLAMGWFRGGDAALGTLFLLVWLGFWTFACLQILATLSRGWRDALRPGIGVGTRIAGIGVALVSTLVGLPFLAGEVFGLFMLSQVSSAWTAPLAVALGAINWGFLYLLKQPTRAGRALMDQIDGFRMYLTTAAGDALRQAPPRTPQRFEAMLPYAIALGVEDQWSARFEDVLRAAGRGDDPAYTPTWYRGRAWNQLGSARFSAMVGGSLSSAVASSATAPGSRSGRSSSS
jgi:hypothetical protein